MMDAVVVAPHPDDETLGVGGTVARLSGAGARVAVLTIGGHLPPLYPPEVYEQSRECAARAHRTLGVEKSVFLDLPAVLLSQLPVAELNGAVQEFVDTHRPGMVFLPFPDRHVDHRAVFQAGMVATRPIRSGREITMVALYETLSETFWNAPGAEPTFAPNWTTDISSTIDKKIKALAEYQSEVTPVPGPRSLEAVRALSVFRGSQSNFAYGEAFQIARAAMSPVALHRSGRHNAQS
jgi:LmbE family N-acetylglucosaminyl deacetylase